MEVDFELVGVEAGRRLKGRCTRLAETYNP